ncbi:hypothetical protein L484_004904 [Morus notabilis]|uniref:Integrator complex subunit 7 n=1 Tax=Morus notabilis TaxID=981085 RepID=W9RE68_9ROSA|nr:hypothetical protein L484_004904 [Morus notabilis]
MNVGLVEKSGMERNSAACAMQWSIDLEKGLRSKIPGQPSEAILDFGPRLRQWSRERGPTFVAHHMFDLIPGEDRLFANAIFLRLADAFRFGDEKIRVSVAKVFLMEYRSREKRKGYKGLLSKGRVSNSMELLSRVKIVFDNGDVCSRALALVIFGCWADFAKDSANIRYLVLSSMVSPHVLEAKAALFAAGCFCELSDDFPCVVLEMLTNLMTSSETLSPIRLAAARLYAKMGCSYSTATRAYKRGLKLALDSAEEDYQVALLISLSKIACTSTILISDQVLLCMQSDSTVDSLDLDKLSTIAEDVSPSPIRSMSLLAILVLVDISYKFKCRRERGSVLVRPSPVPSQVVSKIFNRISFLVKSLFDPCHTDSVVYQELNNLLNLLLSMVREHPDLDVLVLDQIFVLVRHLSRMNENVMSTAQIDSLVHESSNTDQGKSATIRGKLACKVYSFLVTYLEDLSEAGSITMPVFEKVKLLVEHVCECKLLNSYTHTLFSLLLHSSVIWGNISEESFKLDGNSGILPHNYSIEHELITIEFAKKLMEENKYWPAYKAGMYSACQGAWFTCTFIFQPLIAQVRSDLCGCWIKSLLQFAHSEIQIMLFHLTKQDSSITVRSETIKLPLRYLSDDQDEMDHDALYEPCYSKVLLSAYNSICSSKEVLDASATSGQMFCFQRWFLSLRAKALRAVVDALETLGTILSGGSNWWVGKSFVAEFVLSFKKIAQLSMQLKRLAKEFDLFSASFIDIDSKSSKVISALALSSSLLAFITGFALFIPTLPETLSGLKNSKTNLQAHLIQNLAGRLCHADHEISSKLCQLLDVSEHQRINCCHLQLGSQAFNLACEARDVLSLCSYAVSEVARLRSEADITHNEENTSRVIEDGIQLTLKILEKWTQIPLRTPKYFFQLRSCIGSELFAVSSTKNPDGIYVSRGYQLSLSLCLQLRNVPPDLPVRLAKFYCMLYCSESFQEPRPVQENNEQSKSSRQAWETDDMVEVNARLLHYVTHRVTNNTNGGKSGCGIDDCGFVNAFVCVEPNERWQGFSSCLLDVSRFPAGSYRIKWCSCCIDDQGNYWNLLPFNAGPVFTVE